jgi:hypothetical protein
MKIGIILAVIAIILSVFVLVAPNRADAHNPDPYAYWYCSLHRSDPSATVTHSEAWALYPGEIIYWCIQDPHFFGVTHQYYVRVSPPFSGNSTRVSGYQNCNLIVCETH